MLNKTALQPALAFDEKPLILRHKEIDYANSKIYILAGRRVFIGLLNEYPDYQTQGAHKEELAENLKDLLKDLESGHVP